VESPTSLRTGNWRQGSILDAGPIAGELAKVRAPPCELAVVISQDCDVVADSTIEPAVEIIVAELAAQPDTALLYGRNPRRLCLPLSSGTGYVVLDVRHRYPIGKHALAGHAPRADLTLSAKDVRALARWLGKRYTRDAFPDAFNARLRPAQKELERISKSAAGRHVTTIFVMLEPKDDELDDGADYHVAIWFAWRRDVLDSDAGVEANQFASAFSHALESCPGIVVEDWEVRSHDDITLADLELMKRFDMDFRSEAPKPGGRVLRTPL
jgi:hypothetical protein